MSVRLVAVAVVAAALPFLLLGEGFETQVAGWLRQPRPYGLLAALLTASLAADILLPIPSSVAVSYAASQLGVLPAAVCGTIGLTISCEVGYRLGRCVAGRPQSDTAAGPTLLAVAATRAVPLLAEATVFLAGGVRMPHGRFLAVATASNAVVCLLYGGLGRLGFAAGRELLTLAISVAVPVALSGIAAVVVRRRTLREPR